MFVVDDNLHPRRIRVGGSAGGGIYYASGDSDTRSISQILRLRQVGCIDYFNPYGVLIDPTMDLTHVSYCRAE